MVISCLLLPIMFPRLSAASCENIVRLADLQDIMKNQTKLIEDQRHVNQELNQVVDKQAKLIDDLRNKIENTTSGVYFTVGLSKDTTFTELEIIKFDKIITNVGRGYIDDNNSTDYGKFIAPQNGTYQFKVNVYSHNERIGGDLIRNNQLVLGTKSGNGGAASLSVILDLKENDEVHLLKPHWVGNEVKYNHFFTSFSGALLHVKV